MLSNENHTCNTWYRDSLDGEAFWPRAHAEPLPSVIPAKAGIHG